MTEIVNAKNRVSLQAALGALPIFPLGQVALFPNALLPLHIFEPRYRALLKDCLETHGALAIAHVEDPADVDELGHPKISPLAGAGVIVEHEMLPGGRANIVLRGVARVRLEELPFVPPYRHARAVVVPDHESSVKSADRAALLGAATAFASAVRRHDKSFSFQVPADLDDGALADVCAHHLLVDPAARQTVLEQPDVNERVHLVTRELIVQRTALFGVAGGALN
ncbi:MAG: LON peptidase substrate-binding domain-containing protein [Polyangiaceae bacterium]